MPLLSILVLVTFLPISQAAEPVWVPPFFAGVAYPSTVDDKAVKQALSDAGEQFVREGQATPGNTITNQLTRRFCRLELPKCGKVKHEEQRLAALTHPGVLIVARLYLCKDCGHLHASAASGFMITKGGAFVTSCHVFLREDFVTAVAMTGEGKIYPVAEILAANSESDVAIGRLAGSGFTALPLSRKALPGTRVLVNSHPHEHFFSLSEGIVARHFWEESGSQNLPTIAITADFGPGSSGAPVLDFCGSVIGVVDSIAVHTAVEGSVSNGNPAFIFKHCRPSSAVLDLIQPK